MTLVMITLCNDSHDDNSHEPNGRTLRHAFGKSTNIARGAGGEPVRHLLGRFLCLPKGSTTQDHANRHNLV